MTTRILLSATLALAMAAPAHAQPLLESLRWMGGHWVEETAVGRTLQTWLGPEGGMMVAAHLGVMGPGRTSFEYLRIVQGASGLVFYASPGGMPAVAFPLKESGDARVVFERPGENFPQRIIYRREGDALVARIEGVVGGELRFQQWRFVPRPGNSR